MAVHTGVFNEAIWRNKTDDEVVGASLRLIDYTEEAQQVIRAEMARRALVAAEPIGPDPAEEEQLYKLTGFFSRLWNGQLPLVRAYWLFGFGASMFWRLVEAILALNPGAVQLVVVCELCYFVVAWTGIWRSAGLYRGRRVWRGMARMSVTWGIVMTVINLLTGLFGDPSTP